MPDRYANIIIDISHEKLDRSFQYRIPEDLYAQVYPGVAVNVPFGKGNRQIRGFVIEVTERAEFDPGKLKEIDSIASDAMAIESQLIALAAWMRRNYGATMNQALKAVIPVKRKAKAKEKRMVCLIMEKEAARAQLEEFTRRHNTARARLLEELLAHPEISYEIVTGKLNITANVVRALEEKNILKVVHEVDYRNPVGHLQQTGRRVELSEAQRQVTDRVLADLHQGIHKTYLLHGVTGSGKTEVYIEMIRRVVERGRQAIVLIPEIALTYQTVLRFYARFGDRVSILNSRMSAGERYDQMERVKRGEVDVMIGPRSALFTPFLNLGLIVVDEEHESTYKSEQVPRYHARETAIARAQMEEASVVLGSATPSLEAFYRCKTGDSVMFELTKRAAGQNLPVVYTVDMREELRRGNRSILSDRLKEKVRERLNKGQ